MNSADIEISEYKGEGYKPMIDYGKWRVAVLRYCDELVATAIEKMQKHNETDEVFVLLEGSCILFTAGSKEQPNHILATTMEPSKLYNVKKGTWHTHTLSEDALVLIVENKDTALCNSPEAYLTKEQRERLIYLGKQV
ncbi:MAG: WxcM-like protein [Clostridia bacterium]|jgi:ureidoglycolate hydrolase|nr:WxcM-like protein [Clostridia bacterium]